MSALDVSEWIGRSETLRDHVAREPFDRLAAMLDRTPEAATIPPMGHLLCFLPGAAQSEIGADGHPRRGGIVPPIDLPMRMAAGSRVSFHAPVSFDADIRRVSTIANVTEKNGRLAKELVEILNRSQQNIPPELKTMGAFSSGGRGRGRR